MTGKSIPQAGEPFLGAQSAATKVAMVRMYATASVTSDCDTDDVNVTVVADTTAAAAAYHLFYVPAGTVVHDIYVQTLTSWGADTTVCEFLLGDTTGNDTYLTDTQYGAGTTQADDVIMSVMELNASKMSKVYKTADYIDATFTYATSAFAAAGLTNFWLVYSNAF